MVSPWWYKVLAGQIVAAVLLGLGMVFDNFPFGNLPIGLALVIAALVAVPLTVVRLRSATGGGTDRYEGLGSVMVSALIGLLAVGVAGQYLLNWGWSMLVIAIVGFVVAVWFEMRVDQRAV